MEFSEIDPVNLFSNWEQIFRHIESNSRFYTLLVNNGLMVLVLDRLNQRMLQEDYNEFILWNGMIYNVCLEWIKGGMKESSDEMMSTVKTALSSIAAKIIQNESKE